MSLSYCCVEFKNSYWIFVLDLAIYNNELQCIDQGVRGLSAFLLTH